MLKDLPGTAGCIGLHLDGIRMRTQNAIASDQIRIHRALPIANTTAVERISKSFVSLFSSAQANVAS